MGDINKHIRVNDILLGPLERPALKWLAASLPAWITPDICTAIGVLGAVVIAGSYILSTVDRNFLWLASLGFAINWFGDSLDGTLARYRQIERPVFGFFLDHTTDAVNEVMICVGLGLTPYVNFDVACLMMTAYLLMSLLVFVRTAAVGEFKISYGRLGPTEVRVLAILLNTVMYFGGVRNYSIAAGPYGALVLSPYDLAVGFVGLLLLGFFFTTAIQEGRRLSSAEAKLRARPG
jgi:archaetidylinositol phosphate synthase